jgi:hypothetical protein
MSNTPRTDAAAQTCMDASSEWCGEWVPLELCQQLERELTVVQINAARYEYLRKLSPMEFRKLWKDCIFDDLIFDAEVDRRRSAT